MPLINAYADVFRDWEALLLALEQSEDLLPVTEQYQADLTRILEEVRVLKARQDTLRAGKQGTTQELQATVVRGRDVASRIRGVVKATLGPKSERLVHYGIVPTRRRSRRAAPATPAAPSPPSLPQGPPPATT